MEREETNSSHYVASRTALWCPICGAKENHGCTPVKGLRFSGHNLSATGQVSRPALTPSFWETTPARRDVPDAQRRRLWI